MTIENSLERIAIALETIVGSAGSKPQQAEAPAPKAPRKQRAVTEQPKDPVPEQPKESFDEEPAAHAPSEGGFDDEPAAAVVEEVPTKEDMIAALTAFGTVAGTDEARKLMAKYGNNAAKASDVPESKRADVIKQANDAKAKAEKAKAAKK